MKNPTLDEQFDLLASAPPGAHIRLTVNTHNGWHTRRPVILATRYSIRIDVGGGREAEITKEDVRGHFEHDFVPQRSRANQPELFAAPQQELGI